jgi:hypothetical protein
MPQPCRGIAVLLAGLLFLQALAVAHAFDHPAAGHADHQCIACLHGHGNGFAPAADAPATVTPATHEHAAPEDIRAPATPRFHAYRSRAPPVSSLL